MSTPMSTRDEASEVAALRAELASMQAEDARLSAILELEAMKQALLHTKVPLPPRAAWSHEPASPLCEDLEPDQEDSAPPRIALHPTASGDALSDEDERRLARLLAEDEEAEQFCAQTPAAMAATLARMEDELAALTLRRDEQSQHEELAQLKAQLELAKVDEQDARETALMQLTALQAASTADS